MTVSTAYFDFVFRSKNEVTADLEDSIEQLERRQKKVAKLQSLVDERSSAKRLRRLAKWTALTESSETTNDELIGRLNTLEAVELPKDEVTFGFWNPTDDISGVQVTITDSPYDDSFVGGQRTALYLRGTGKQNEREGISSFGSRASLVPETFEDGTDTFGIAGTNWTDKVDGSYPDVTVSLLQGYTPSEGPSAEQSFVTALITDGQVVI